MFDRLNSKLLRLGLTLVGLTILLLSTLGSAQAIQQTPYVWRQGDQPFPMIPTTNSACFLTGMSGKFQGSGEVIRVTKRNGFWYLEGTSKQKGVMATARCITGSSTKPIVVSGTYSWHQDNGFPTRLSPTSNSACFLTEVSGKFQGSGEAVQIVSDYGYWWLTGKSRQKSVSAKAICIVSGIRQVSKKYTWRQGQSPTYMENSDCFLTMVSGKFMGRGELVTIDYVPDYKRFILWGRSNQRGVQAGARCVRY